MAPEVAFSSIQFLTMPRRQQNELIYSLLSPIARCDLERELDWLRTKRDQVEKKVEEMEKSVCDAELTFENVPLTPSDICQYTNKSNQNNLFKYGHQLQTTKTSLSFGHSSSLYSNHIDNSDVDGNCNLRLCTSPPSEEEDIPAIVIRSRKMNKKVILNVGGVKHEVMWRMLEKQPRSRLGLLSMATTPSQILNLCDAYSLEENEYYFDRHPRTFNCILNFYRTGKLHMMEEVCVMDFSQDLDYWMIDDIYLEACCEGKYSIKKEHVVTEVKKNSKVNKVEEVHEDFGDGCCAVYQRCLWNLMEKPNSSFPAKVISLFSITLVLISTVGMCLNTMPEFKIPDEGGKRTMENPIFALIEACCISWFTIEYLLRLAGSPIKWEFLKGPLNVVDVLAILPYYLSLVLMDESEIPKPKGTESDMLEMTKVTVMEKEDEGAGFDDMSRIVQVFRIARIMRIFKLARSSQGLQAIAHTMKSSYKELSLLLLFVGMGMLIFGSLCYFVEKDAENTLYTSIPESMWWAIQTMTSVGYGDLFPTTVLGKLIGSCCGVSGILVMALPIPIVVENFGAYYMEQKKRAVIAAKKQDIVEAKIAETAAGQTEMDQLASLLQTKPGPFKAVPDSPMELLLLERDRNGRN